MSTIPTISTDHFYGQQNLNKGHRKASDAILQEFLEAIKADILNIEDQGSPAVVQLIQGGQPVAGETLTIGSDVYEADGSGTNINFVIAGSAELTMDNLLAAAIANGTENLFWDKQSTTALRFRSASGPQGTVQGADPSIVLDASSITNYSFDVGDVNMNTLAGKAKGIVNMLSTKITITTAMITAGIVRVSCPFTPSSFQITVINASGALELAITDTFAVDDGDILITLNGGAGDLANTDVVHFTIFA
jgi:hypothetical protein